MNQYQLDTIKCLKTACKLADLDGAHYLSASVMRMAIDVGIFKNFSDPYPPDWNFPHFFTHDGGIIPATVKALEEGLKLKGYLD